MSNSTETTNFYDQEFLEAEGLRVTHTCPNVYDGGKVTIYWPETECFMCAAPVITSEPDQGQAYLDWLDSDGDPRFKDAGLIKSGAGDWGKGHDIFQLPQDCPDRVVHSQAEMKSVYKKYGLDADSHQFKQGQGPASPNRRRRGGSLALDNHDRDLGY